MHLPYTKKLTGRTKNKSRRNLDSKPLKHPLDDKSRNSCVPISLTVIERLLQVIKGSGNSFLSSWICAFALWARSEAYWSNPGIMIKPLLFVTVQSPWPLPVSEGLLLIMDSVSKESLPSTSSCFIRSKISVFTLLPWSFCQTDIMLRYMRARILYAIVTS